MAETIPRIVLQMAGGFAIWQISSRSAIWIIQADRPVFGDLADGNGSSPKWMQQSAQAVIHFGIRKTATKACRESTFWPHPFRIDLLLYWHRGWDSRRCQHHLHAEARNRRLTCIRK
jgi:hypothetical protein